MSTFHTCDVPTSLWCRVIVDNIVLKEFKFGGFTPFWVSVPASTNSTRQLVVVVDNRFSPERTPTQYGYYDFYQYGGLIRAVTLHVVPQAYIQRVEVAPLLDPSCNTTFCGPSGRVS